MLVLLACAEDPAGHRRPPPAESPAPVETSDTGTPPAPLPTGDTGVAVDTGWDHFVAHREEYLVALGDPILRCVPRDDTPHPVFHGCVDWHSAVHANYALHALHRLTGDPQYLDVAGSVLDPFALEQELAILRNGGLASEVPYGFAWFLVLAREREATTGALDLVPLAAEVEARLADHVRTIPGPEVPFHVLDDEYGNLSWAVLQLWEQAVWDGDLALQQEWEDYVRDRFLPLDEACPLADDASAIGFFPPCLHRARTILAVLPPAEAEAWAADFLPATLALPPRTSFPTVHAAGSNFSRSWDLWLVWEVTADPMWRTRYVRHVETHLGLPEYWSRNHALYAHWVAQFGVYGIALSYE